MTKREDYLRQMDENLALWKARLQTIKTKLTSPADEETDDEKKLEKWQAEGDAVAQMLEKLKATHGDDFDAGKQKMDKVWHELDTLMNQAEQRVRKVEDKVSETTGKPVPGPDPVTG